MIILFSKQIPPFKGRLQTQAVFPFFSFCLQRCGIESAHSRHRCRGWNTPTNGDVNWMEHGAALIHEANKSKASKSSC